MAELVLLGTGAAVTDPFRTTTMLAIRGSGGVIAIDCGGDLVHRMLAAGIHPSDLRALILTHEHADHTSGFPLFMEKIWLHGRRDPLPVFGPESGISQAKRVFATYDTSRWEGLPEIFWHPVPMEEHAPVFQKWGFDVTAAPGDHGVPVLGFRFRNTEDGGVAVYSSDTAPAASIEALSLGANLLVHEGTGATSGHTSPAQAAALAKRARVKRLVLVHLGIDPFSDIENAKNVFQKVEAGKELATYAF